VTDVEPQKKQTEVYERNKFCRPPPSFSVFLLSACSVDPFDISFLGVCYFYILFCFELFFPTHARDPDFFKYLINYTMSWETVNCEHRYRLEDSIKMEGCEVE
jgi:hypothetical protein